MKRRLSQISEPSFVLRNCGEPVALGNLSLCDCCVVSLSESHAVGLVITSLLKRFLKS